MLHGAINHIALTVSDLPAAMRFMAPLLERLGYTSGEVLESTGTQLVVSINRANGTAVNVWQAKGEGAGHPFEVYEPGLHHIAFNVAAHEDVDAVANLVRELGGEVQGGPAPRARIPREGCARVRDTSPILVLTGSPGSGKTTAARLLAAASPHGLHLRTDDLFEWPAHKVDPTDPESRRQNEAVVRAFCRAASAFHEAGYEVVIDGPWMLPLVGDELGRAGLGFDYAVLRVELETAISRGTGRSETPVPRRVVEQMHAGFEELGRFEAHALDARGLDPDAVVARIQRNRARLHIPAGTSFE